MDHSSTETLGTVLSDDNIEEATSVYVEKQSAKTKKIEPPTPKDGKLLIWITTSIWFKQHSTDVTRFTVLSIFTAFFAWATIYYFSKTGVGWENFNATLCTGYGLLVVLFSIYILGLFYSIVIKSKVPLIYQSIYKPFVNILNGIWYGSTIFYIAILAAFSIYLGFDTNENRKRLIPISGLILFIFVGYIFSHNRPAIQWRIIIWGLILQFVFGLLTIRWDVGRNILQCFGDKVDALLGYAFKGAEFAFGSTIINDNVFAFKALSTVYFIGFLVNVLYYYGIMQSVIGAIGNFLQYIMGTSICESVNSAANIFLGLSEAPLILAPYLKSLTDSELHSIMTSGFATVSGSVMAAYISYGARPQDLITSSIMSAPAALCFSKMMYPETETVKVRKENIQAVDIEYDSVLDAASKGASTAIGMVHGIVASVIAFLASVYLINGVLGWCGTLVGFTDPVWSLELITGKIFIPVSFVMGVPWEECERVGTLIGIKTMVNEFVAFAKMHDMIEAGQLSARTKVIATYAICGFSNPGSIGITISSLGALVPDKREVVTRLVFRAWFGGALVCFMTACIAGTLMPDNAIF